MKKDENRERTQSFQRPPMPPRIPGGATRPTQSLGKWIDNLLGDRRIRERAKKHVEGLFEPSN